MTDRHVVGVDLGGTKIRAALADMTGAVLHEVTLPTVNGPDRPVGRVALAVRTLIDELDPPGPVVCTAVGGAGVVGPQRDSFSRAPNLGSGGDQPGGESFALALEARLGHPVILDNDVNAAAIGELHHGVGRRMESFAFVALGTGIGMGLVVNRRLLRGAHGAAGEIGYLPIGADPTDPANHERGPLEEVLAGTELAARYHRLTGQDRATADVIGLARRGDEMARQTLDVYVHHLALALVAVDAVVDPGAFVLGGGIGSRSELLAPTRRWLRRLGHPDIEIGVSELGPRAGVVGAVEIAQGAARHPDRKEQKHEQRCRAHSP